MHTYIHPCIHTYIHTYCACMHVCKHVRMYACMYVCMCVCVYVYIYLHTYVIIHLFFRVDHICNKYKYESKCIDTSFEVALLFREALPRAQVRKQLPRRIAHANMTELASSPQHWPTTGRAWTLNEELNRRHRCAISPPTLNCSSAG